MNVELLSPAGSFQTALAAFAAGADAVYCGLTEFSARAFADNFTLADLGNLLRYAHANGRKVYVTFNTVIDEDAVEEALERLSELDGLRPDALIVQDLGIARLCRKYFPGLALHASTQLVAHNLEGVLALKELGFTRVVLSRELSLEEIRSIARRCGGMELECFVHGALCYSVSGLCLFGAMEKGRSGNRGKCPYCCRQTFEDPDGRRLLAFSMKDLRLGADVAKLVDAGVVSLKIEGRMKSELYVASVTRYYRDLLDRAAGAAPTGRSVTVADLETVFSRRTTQLYFNGSADSPIDPDSLGHLGTEIGVIKRVTKDRDGVSWLRFHTARALERHDGLQFELMVDDRHLGMGVTDMRQAISRRNVFEVPAGTDVEVRLPEADSLENGFRLLKPGMKIYCSMSNAVKRMFPSVGFRPSECPGGVAVDLAVALAADRIEARVVGPDGLLAALGESEVAVSITCALTPAKSPEKTFGAVEKAFSKLGETDYRLGRLAVDDPDRLFAPMSVLNDLRRDLVERLDERRGTMRRDRLASARADDVGLSDPALSAARPLRTVKIRPDQRIPAGAYDEVIVAIDADTVADALSVLSAGDVPLRLALPVYTVEPAFNRLRVTVKGLLRKGYGRWEASDLATLRLLRSLGVTDITADWTLYAFNLSALRQLADLGVQRFVASPENTRENLQFLFESGYSVEFLRQQSTPLFVSLTKPAGDSAELMGPDGVPVTVARRNGLWVTTRPVPRTFEVPAGASERLDLSWDPF